MKSIFPKSKMFLFALLLFLSNSLAWGQLDSCFQVSPIIIPPSCSTANDGAIHLVVTGSDSTLSYFWENGDTTSTQLGLGEGVYNAQVTNNDFCTTTLGQISNFNNPEPLPDGAGVSYLFTEQINFANNPTISPEDLIEIKLNIEHSWLFDLEIILISPNGTEILLQQHVFGSTLGQVFLGEPVDDNENTIPGIGYDYTWSNQTSTPNISQYLADLMDTPTTLPSGTYSPLQPLSVLEGEPMNGTWRLEIRDQLTLDDGFIFGWTIQFNNNTSSTINLENNVNDCSTCNLSINCMPWLINQTLSPATTQIDTATWNNRTLFIVAKEDSCCSLTQNFYTCSGQLIQTNQTTNEGQDISTPSPLFITAADYTNHQTIWTPTSPLPPCENLVIDITNETIPCHGGITGNICSIIDGGTPPFSFLWTNNNEEQISTDSCVSNLSTGIYNLVVTDANGIYNQTSIEITQPEALLLADFEVMLDSNNICVPVDTLDFDATGGIMPYTFTTETDNQLSTTVWVIDANGCIDSTIIQCNNSISQVIVDINNVNCHGDNTGGACATPLGGIPPFSFIWTNQESEVISTEDCIDHVISGFYTLIVNDSNGQTYETSIEITQPEALLLADFEVMLDSNNICVPVDTLDFDATGGIMPYTFTTETDNQLSTTVWVIDANGCIDSTTIQCNNSISQVIVDINNVNCHGDNTGAACAAPLGGIPPFSFIWTNQESEVISTEDCIDHVISGFYTLIVNDANGQTYETSIEITQPEALLLADFEVMLDSNNICVPVDTLDFDATGGIMPYTFTTETDNQLSTTVWVIDANGCIDSTTIQCNNSITDITLDITNVDCHGNSTGTACATPLGGTPPYLYEWTNHIGNVVANNDCIVDVTAGIYVLQITDKVGNIFTQEVNITEPTSIEIDIELSIIDNNCTPQINTTGGVAPYDINWTPNIGPSGTEFIITATDANGCIITDSTICIIDNTLDIKNLEYSNIYPNPSNGSFSVDVSFSIEEEGQIKVYNILGETIYNTFFIGKEFVKDIYITPVTTGIYILEISTKNGAISQKLIIE